jgi:hypothetical protein
MTAHRFTLSLFAGLCLSTSVSAQAPAGHNHGAEMPGLKKEMFAGITAEDLLKMSDKPKTVKVVLVATFNAANYGMNFNGYSHGNAVLTVPKDWTIEVTFINPSPIPHSAIVIDKAETKKLQVPEPYFEGGASPKHIQGMSSGKAEFSFLADEAGEFALACGFPAHSATGHWLGLNISDDASIPTLKLGDLPAKEIK